MSLSQDFEIELRVDPFAMNMNDRLYGRNPAVFYVRQGKADLASIRDIVDFQLTPSGRHMASNMSEILALDRFSFIDFYKAMFNLSQREHRLLIQKVFGQAPRLPRAPSAPAPVQAQS